MKIKITTSAFQNKPGPEQMKKVCWELKNNASVETDFLNLKKIIEEGHSFILAEFKKRGNISCENIRCIEAIALDIDSKEHEISMHEMIDYVYKKIGVIPVLYYRTFSDQNCTKFRLIYKCEAVDAEAYKAIYEALAWKFKYIDKQAKNPNRIWAGTNKEVFYNAEANTFDFEKMVQITQKYKRHKNRIAKEEERKRKIFDSIKYENKKVEISDIRELSDYIIENISLIDYIKKHFGGNFKKVNGGWQGACSLHGGDNASALFVGSRIYTCYTHCGTGNVITLAKIVYNTDNFVEAVLNLIKEYNLECNLIEERYGEK